jgi:hypothetical protein
MLEVKECRWGNECKYMYKCKFSHPIQAARKLERHKLTHLATSFGDTELASDAQVDSYVTFMLPHKMYPHRSID